MISVIVCSIDRAKFARIDALYKSALAGEEWELIGIHDAKSLAEGYNRGIAHSRGEIVIFSHDDIELLSPHFAERLKGHLAKFDLIGVAGTSRVVNGGWVNAGPPHIFGQVAHLGREGMIAVNIYGAPRPSVGNIQGLDKFHLYDVDFSFAAFQMGFKLGVACDINLLHHSSGRFREEWAEHMLRFNHKWFGGRAHNGPVFVAQWSIIQVPTRQQAAELMNPPFWEWE